MPAPKRPYRQLEHTGDIRVRVVGGSLKGLFRNSVVTLTDLLVDVRAVRRRSSRSVRVRAETSELLLVRLLQEVLFLFDAKRFVARGLEYLTWTPTEIRAKVWGERLDVERHYPKGEIKAVTMHGLKIGRRGTRWFSEIVFDV